MSNFNKIFALVKKHCIGGSLHPDETKFEEIASEAGVTFERLHFYLDCLQEIGMLRYDKKNRKISLTSKGEKAKRIFSE
jgi:predicted transcriptional regulator